MNLKIVTILNYAKKNYAKIFIFCLLLNLPVWASEKSYPELKEQAFALYSTENYDEAFKILDDFPVVEKDKDIYLILSNIAYQKDNKNLAISNLNKSLNRDYSFYKAYYNLGCIFAQKESYALALNNFEIAIKYKKDFAPAYFNLACCFIKLKDYKSAKKNLLKALELDPNNKNIYYNLAYCYKMLNNPKQAKKILEVYDKASIQS